VTLANLDPQVLDGLSRLQADMPVFASKALFIRAKDGAIKPLVLNRTQRHIHQRLEAQRARTGRVRAIILKGRQGGCSTYIQARFYHRLWSTHRAMRAFILTHEQPATDNLFGMAQRFHQLHPIQYLKPATKAANAKELRFEHNDCGYQVSTAGTKETGRSATFQLFHGSESAFWPNAQEHVTGAFQTVGDAQGTEIILESTANGVGNMFYHLCQAAIRGNSDYEAIFIPWHWSEDYERECPPDWQPSIEWYEYARAHDLTWEQLYWVFLKNRELANSISAPSDRPCWKFMQEYPATFDEAFQSSGNSFIPATSVLRARRPAETIIGAGPVILGIDPARSGDKVGIIDRCGRRLGERIAERMDPGGSVTYVASQVAARIDRIKPDLVNIDVGSNGAGVYDLLMDWGYGDILTAVDFGSNPISKGPTGDDVYFNRRAEMYDLMRQWFDGDLPVQIPDDDSLQADLTAAEWGDGKTRYNTSNELVLEEKAAIKKRIGASPDLGDAAALTWAVPFAVKLNAAIVRPDRKRGRRNSRTGY
jgi:hypothetical protein